MRWRRTCSPGRPMKKLLAKKLMDIMAEAGVCLAKAGATAK
ncbi:MAG TPA: hypothetical protein VIV58_37750 [Kofleriaceae bacterium]